MEGKYPDIKKLSWNENLEGQYGILPDVVYSTIEGKELKLTMIVPWTVLPGPEEKKEEKEKRPLLVFVQGSGWTTPDVNLELPQMIRFAEAGYVVAMVVHRSCLDHAPAPAYLQDVKCAIRFLRKSAAQYEIDPERVAIWGTSSGANTAQLVGLTGDMACYKTEEYPEYSDAVNLVVSCFAPTDVTVLAEGEFGKSEDGIQILTGLLGKDRSKWKENAEKISPLYQVEDGENILRI